MSTGRGEHATLVWLPMMRLPAYDEPNLSGRRMVQGDDRTLPGEQRWRPQPFPTSR